MGGGVGGGRGEVPVSAQSPRAISSKSPYHLFIKKSRINIFVEEQSDSKSQRPSLTLKSREFTTPKNADKNPGEPTQEEVTAYNSRKFGALSWGHCRHPEETLAHTEPGDSPREQGELAGGEQPAPRGPDPASRWNPGARTGPSGKGASEGADGAQMTCPRPGEVPQAAAPGGWQRPAPVWSPRGGTRLLSSCTWCPPCPGGPGTAEALLGSALTKVSPWTLRRPPGMFPPRPPS